MGDDASGLEAVVLGVPCDCGDWDWDQGLWYMAEGEWPPNSVVGVNMDERRLVSWWCRWWWWCGLAASMSCIWSDAAGCACSEASLGRPSWW